MGTKELINFHQTCAKNAPNGTIRNAHITMCAYLEHSPEQLNQHNYDSYRKRIEASLNIKMSHSKITN